ncbi:MAG: porin family protein [Scytolyngbya sp. HA4215-MV1]|nr:porin family protein [Scytolyngbya sp. HA4215-MV1]
MAQSRTGIAIALGTMVATSALTLATQTSASAQAAYGSYVGVGASYEVSDGPDNDHELAGVVAARYKFLRLPVSARTQVLIGNGVAIVPTVSYDLPLNWQTDIYLGAGASFPIGNDTTPVGDDVAFALQPGIDVALPNSELVIFGNAIIAFDAYKDGSTATSVQAGVGLRF